MKTKIAGKNIELQFKRSTIGLRCCTKGGWNLIRFNVYTDKEGNRYVIPVSGHNLKPYIHLGFKSAPSSDSDFWDDDDVIEFRNIAALFGFSLSVESEEDDF